MASKPPEAKRDAWSPSFSGIYGGEGARPCQHPDFRFLAPRAVRLFCFSKPLRVGPFAPAALAY